VLYELVTGEHPFGALVMESLPSVALLDRPMPSVRERLPAIGKLGAVIDRCLIKPKASRLGSAWELLIELEAVARPALGAAGDGLEDENPYAGLSAFQEQDAARFFGRERHLLTEASYRAFGGVGGALASHADSVLGGLSNAERRWTRLLLLRPVTPERTRTLVTRGDLAELAGATSAELTRVLGRLIDARLVTVEGAGRDESTVELVHESLIATWPALLRVAREAIDDLGKIAIADGALREARWRELRRDVGRVNEITAAKL